MTDKEYTPIGEHHIIDCFGCKTNKLNDGLYLNKLIRKAIKDGNATLLNCFSHQFEPQGVTVVATLSESHVSIHTYPEHNFAFLDVFTCGETANAQKIVKTILKALIPEKTSATNGSIKRGFSARENGRYQQTTKN